MVTSVYVSATFTDLRECRAKVQLALRRLHVEDMAMESYVAEVHTPLSKCLADVANCDLYIGIFAWRYGYIPPGEQRSITELEYREALDRRKPCLIFLLDADAPWPRSQMDQGDEARKLDDLRAELAREYLCSTFTGPEDLAAKVTAAVANWLAENGRPSQESESLSEDILRRYFGRLRQRYAGLDLDALSPPQLAEYLQVRLTSVFVEPYLREEPPPPELPREWLERVRDKRGLPADEIPDEVDPEELSSLRELYRAAPRRRLLDVVTEPDHARVVLLGDPGSGKSTVARYLALALAGGPADERLAPFTDHLPILVELRSYVAVAADGRCHNVLDYLDHRAGTDGSGLERARLERYLAAGGPALAVFDGLDEVFDRRRREEVASEIAGFATEYPQVRIVVTSRIIGYSRRTLTNAGFGHFTLQDLGDDQVAEFLATWYGLTAQDRAEGRESSHARLLEAIGSSPALRELAGNPLLLTILAIIGRHQPLPRDRWKLYDHASAVLVEQWDVNRNLRDQERPDFIDAEDRKALLRRLAYRMQSAERALSANYVDAEVLSQVFEEYLVERYRSTPQAARATALAMINQFRERSFILGRYGPRLYGFVHRTFLEFFCADAIVHKFKHDQEWSLDGIKDLFRRHWAEPSWREVLRLVASALHERHAAQLISLLTDGVNADWPAEEFTDPPWNLALAVQCLAEVRRPHAELAEVSRSLLGKLILLLEHGVSINDVETARLIEEEILPSARIIGTRWSGRELYLSWYERRGVRLVWSPTMSLAAALAAVLALPDDRIEDRFEGVLARLADRRAPYAEVAGLAELAVGPYEELRRRARARMVRRAREAAQPGVRAAAVQALAERDGGDPVVYHLLVDRARQDDSAGVRLAAVQALGERHHSAAESRETLLDRLSSDDNAGVRRAAAVALVSRFSPDRELAARLERRLIEDGDAEVVTLAAGTLADRFEAADKVRKLLVDRLRGDRDPVLRRAAARLVGSRFATDPQVIEALLDCVNRERDPGVLHEVARWLAAGTLDRLRDGLVDRVRADSDEAVRHVCVQALAEHFGADPEARGVAAACARSDRDANVRLAAVESLVPWAAGDLRISALLTDLVRDDQDGGIRRVALAALRDRIWQDPDVAEVFAAAARGDDDPTVRLAATTVLAGGYGVDGALREQMIERCRQDTHPQVRLVAATALAGYGDERSRSALFERAEHDPSGRVFRCAVSAVIDQEGPSARSWELLADRAVRDTNARVRLVAADLLADRYATDPPAVAALAEMVRHDRNPEVFLAAATALSRRPETIPRQSAGPVAEAGHGAVLRWRVEDDDPAIRRAALHVLGEFHGADPDVRDLVIDRVRHDGAIRVRRDALSILGERLPAGPAAHAVFVDCLDDPDWSIREAAVRVLARSYGTAAGTRDLLIRCAREHPDAGIRRLAGQALTWLPGADPEQLPAIAGPGPTGSRLVDPGRLPAVPG